MSNQGSKIIFEVGTRLEAQDFTQNWYPARICRIDHSGKKALIHFEGWNHRFDEWISFDSERLRPSSRHPENKDDKGDKSSHSPQDVCNYKEWKVGDRTLAKWIDGKFYPAKITKKNEDGVFEVLFYDGIKKNIQRMNLKVDNRKTQALAISKDRLSQQSERIQRKTLLANARAERARKRSKELGEKSLSGILVKRREKNKKQRLDSETVSHKEPSLPSPAETSDGVQKTDITVQDDDTKKISGTSSFTTEDVETKAMENKINTSTDSTDKKEDMEKETSTKEEKNKSELSIEQVLESKHSVPKENEGEKESISVEEEEKSPQQNTSSNEKTRLETSEEVDKDDSSKPLKELASPMEGAESITKITSPLKNEILGNFASETVESTKVNLSKEKVNLSKEKPKDTGSTLEKPSSDFSEKSTSVSIEAEKKQDEIVQLKENDTSGQENVLNEPKMTEKPQESQANDSKSSLEKANEQQVENNYITNIVQVIEEPKQTDNKTTAKKQNKVPPKTLKKGKGVHGSTGEKKRATRSRSAISPRGYGYSMAVMHPQVSKPESNPVQTISSSNETTESIENIIDSLSEDTAVVEINTPEQDDSKQESINEVSVSQPKVKTKNFQAKKFRLDQITVKLSAQRQSEAEAALESPSAFQMTVQPSSSPPMLPTSPAAALPTQPPPKAPSPPAPLASPYPMDTSFNVPPPLIYAPMAAQCCSNPHCQQHAGVYPTPPRAQLHGGISHPMHLPPSHLHPHSAGYVMFPPGHAPTYDTRPPISACSCAACSGPVYHHLPPDAGPRHESALARLMQVEQRILHAGPIPSPHMAHYRDSTPHHGPWVQHGHPHATQYCPLPTKHEDIWRHERPPHQPKSPSHVSPVPESEAAKMMRRWKNEMSFPPVSSISTDMIPGRADELLPQGKHSGHGETLPRETAALSVPRELKQQPEKSLKENMKTKEVEKDKPQQTTTHPKPCENLVEQEIHSSTASKVQSTTVSTPSYSQVTSLGGKARKGKEPAVGPAPKELVIDLDHNKYKCPIKGCDKSFRKESGLDYHMKYYHSPGGKEVKRKRSSASMRSDGTPESSPDVPGPSVTKRRCHRSSAPGQLSCEPLPGTPVSTSTGDTKQDTSLEPTPESLQVKDETPSKAAGIQDVELEIEPGTETDTIYCGSVESVEVEEEDVHNGDVIRCRCEETDEGGFMIQCEQCLTWQHSECVGLTEQTVPSKYLCYICSNPKGLRRRAKYRNDFDWFKKGSLPMFSFVTEENQEYKSEISLATHDLMSDVHSVDNVLKSLRVKLDILRSPNHPALGMWYKPTQKNELPELALKNPDTPETVKSSIETSLLMVKSDRLSNGLEGPTKLSLTDHNQNGIESSFSNGDGRMVNGEITSASPRGRSSQQEPLNLTVNSSVNTGGSEEEAVSPLPPLVPVGGALRQGDSETNVVDSMKSNEKHLNNNIENQEKTACKDTSVSVHVADSSEHSIQLKRSCNPSGVEKNDGDSFDLSETKDEIATSNLLDDVSELQDSLDARMDVIEQQIEVLEQTQDNYDKLDATKPDLRKLAKDLNRIKRLALHVG